MSAPSDPPGGVNWAPVPALDAVQRAVEEEKLTDPAAIVAWAKQRYQLDLTTEQVAALLPQVLHPTKPHSHKHHH
jgi:hypothetical protein